MEQIINAQINANTAGLKWGKSFIKGDEYKTLKEKLITNRIRLKRIKRACSVNTAAAVFGESQVGKSYLVDNILKSSKGPIMVYGGQGKYYGFIDKINPIGLGKESTSLITRFSSQQVSQNDDYPILVRLLKPVDIVLTLCDTFFNDIEISEEDIPSRELINTFLRGLESKYSHRDEVQHYISEDELYEMKQYFNNGVLKSGQTFSFHLRQECFFERVASFIASVDVDEWVEIFSFLWIGNKIFTEVFNRLVNSYKALGFHDEVSIKIDAVLRQGGTILHVDRLYELFDVTEYSEGTNVISVEFAKEKDMQVWIGNTTVTMKKSEFCALSAEVVLKVDEDVISEKDFLRELDILDFPGARSRDQFKTANISQAIACGLLIRGKVAYLFNKYSQQYLISNLLFCHHGLQSDVKTLSGLLGGWVKGMVGETVEKRTEFMKFTDVSPLFIIATKFNSDLKKIPNDGPDTITARWSTRFTNLANLIGPQVKWLNEWVQTNDGKKEPFRNCYLLRAYDFSCSDGIYQGYLDDDNKIQLDENGKVKGETNVSEKYYDFLPKLKKAFLENTFVQNHFQNPDIAWDKAVSPYDFKVLSKERPDYETELKKHSQVIDKVDGSDWILENLIKSSRKIKELRKYQFDLLVDSALDTLCAELGSHFHDENSDASLRNAFRNAGSITFISDSLFGRDKYFFSEFIESLCVHEDELNDKVLNTIRANSIIESTDLAELFAIRNRASIDPSVGEEENRRRIREAYYILNDDELDQWLAGRNLTMEMIMNPPDVRNLAAIIVEDVTDYWLNSYLSLERVEDFVKRGLPEKDLDNLLKNLTALFASKLKVPERIVDRVHNLCTSIQHLAQMAEMIADICAEMINQFVNTAGTAYFTDELWNGIEATISHNGLELSLADLRKSDSSIEETKVRADLPDIFDIFDNVDTILNEVPVNEDKLSRFSNYHFYRKWTEMMKVAFLAVCDIPTYDIVANNALREVLVTSILKEPSLKGKLKDEDFERFHFTTLRAEVNKENV